MRPGDGSTEFAVSSGLIWQSSAPPGPLHLTRLSAQSPNKQGGRRVLPNPDGIARSAVLLLGWATKRKRMRLH